MRDGLKPAFTMIELIFAIVIIAIVVVSMPMISQVSQKNVENNLAQEAIFAASSELMGATSAYWDQRSMEDADANLTSLARVINIGGDCNSSTRLRPGHIDQPLHRRCLDNDAATGLGSSFLNLDNLVHGNKLIFTDSNDETGYKTTYYSNMSVSSNNNVKTITVTISDSTDTVTVLKAVSTNIGEPDYYKKRVF